MLCKSVRSLITKALVFTNVFVLLPAWDRKRCNRLGKDHHLMLFAGKQENADECSCQLGNVMVWRS